MENKSFVPTRSDDVAKKLSRASSLRFSASTVTMKDANDKTMGMVRGIESADKMPTNRLFELSTAFRKASGGVMLTRIREYGLEFGMVRVKDHTIYVFNPSRGDRFRDPETLRRKNDFLAQLEKGGVIIVNVA